MIKYSIKKRGFIQSLDALSQKWKDNTTPVQHNPHCGWTKLEFTRWFEATVRNRFRQSDWVTWADVRVQPNIAPYAFQIIYLNELYYQATMHHKYAEPMVLHCRGPHGPISYKCPSEVRRLTLEELALVDLQNIQAQGTA